MVLLVKRENNGEAEIQGARACSVRAQSDENLRTLVLTGRAGAFGGILANFRELYICICSPAGGGVRCFCQGLNGLVSAENVNSDEALLIKTTFRDLNP